MAFIEIFKNGEKRKVSKSAFENFFKDSGWVEVGKTPASSSLDSYQVVEKSDNKVKSKVDIEEDKFEASDESNESFEDEWDEVLSEEEDEEIEKPISEMNKEELIAYAKKHDISLAGLSKVSQYREAIREAMRK